MRCVVILLVACADKTGGGDSGPDGSGDSGADPVDCGLLAAVEAAGALEPGQVVTLGAGGAAATWSWTVSDGALDDATAPTPAWTLPDDVGWHSDADLAVAVAATRDGCLPESASASFTLGFVEARRVVVVYNPLVDGSQDVAEAYAAMRGIGASALCPVETSEATTLAGADLSAFLGAIDDCVAAVGEQVHYLVPVYGVPYRVSDRIDNLDGSGLTTTVSLDGLMVYGGAAASWTSAIYNPLYQDGDSQAAEYDPYVPFGEWREDYDDAYYMVARIDGADSSAALDLVDRAAEAQALADKGALAGTVYVDGRYGDTEPASDEWGSYESGEWNMWGMRRAFEDDGRYTVVWDGNDAEFGTDPAPLTCPDALFYAGWYSYYNYNDAFTWAPGAIGGHLDSCSACTIRDGGAWSAEALERGITATYGAVNEPYVAGMPEYDQLHRFLLEGANYGEAAYESTIIGAWMMVFVGDPLYRPFPS